MSTMNPHDPLDQLLKSLGLDPKHTSRLTIDGFDVEAEVRVRHIPGTWTAETRTVRFKLPMPGGQT